MSQEQQQPEETKSFPSNEPSEKAVELFHSLAKALVNMKFFRSSYVKNVDSLLSSGEYSSQDIHEAFRYSSKIERFSTYPLTLLQVACIRRSPFQVAKRFINETSIYQEDAMQALPLHMACNNQDVELVQALLEEDRKYHGNTHLHCDKAGKLPLHLVCISHKPNEEMIRALLNADTKGETVRANDHTGRVPLYYLCSTWRLPLPMYQLLLDADSSVPKASLTLPDNKSMLPVHAAVLHCSSPQVLDYLLQATIRDRVARLGSSTWRDLLRHKFHELVVAYHRPRRKYNTFAPMLDTAFQLLEKYELMEQTSLLELVFWKHSIHNNGASMDPTSRKEARIQSGAEAAIPAILPYMSIVAEEHCRLPSRRLVA